MDQPKFGLKSAVQKRKPEFELNSGFLFKTSEMNYTIGYFLKISSDLIRISTYCAR